MTRTRVAFTREHARCPGRREFGVTPEGIRWAACPCGAYLETMAIPIASADCSMAATEEEEITELERMFALQSPQHPGLTVSLALALALALFEAFSILFEHAAVTLFPFHKLLSKLGGRPHRATRQNPPAGEA